MSTIVRFLRSQSIAVLALLLACGGTSYAGTKLAADSVGTKQLRAGAVTTAKIKDGQVTTADVRNGSLTAADLKAGTLPVLPAPRTSPLRKGETVIGQITGDYDTPSAGVDWKVSASFPIPLPAPPVKSYVDGVTTGETCTGTYAAPTAPPGILCVYAGAAFNPSVGPETHAVGEASRWGFQVGWVTSVVGDTYFWARWAYTQG